MTASKFFSLFLVLTIGIMMVAAGCAPAAAPATTPAKPAATAPATTPPASTTPSTPSAPAATTPSTPAASTPAAPSAQELSFKADTYTNDTEGFTVKYPSDWKKDIPEGTGNIFRAVKPDMSHFFLVYAYATTDEKELISLSDKGFKESQGSNIKREPFQKMKFGNKEGLYTVTNWDYMGGAYNLDTYSYSVISNGKFIVVSTTVLAGNPKDKTQAQEIFNTLTFK